MASADEAAFDVVAPLGEQVTEEFRPAGSLSGLDGRRVAFLWDLLFKGDFVFDQIAEELRASYDGIEFVGHETFGDIHGGDEHRVLSDLPRLFEEHRIDAAVVGVGA